MGRAITVTELNTILATDADVSVLDVRSPEEWADVHIDDSRVQLIPLQELMNDPSKADKPGDTYVICNSGSRSAMAQMLLNTRGISVIDVTGGMQAWKQAGYGVTSDHE